MFWKKKKAQDWSGEKWRVRDEVILTDVGRGQILLPFVSHNNDSTLSEKGTHWRFSAGCGMI